MSRRVSRLQSARHDVPVPCRAAGGNYEPVTPGRAWLTNQAPFPSLLVARTLYYLGTGVGGGARCRGGLRGVLGEGWAGQGSGWVVTGRYCGEMRQRVSAWWRSGCLGRSRGETASCAARPQAALCHHAGVVPSIAFVTFSGLCGLWVLCGDTPDRAVGRQIPRESWLAPMLSPLRSRQTAATLMSPLTGDTAARPPYAAKRSRS